jgi:hypothetical protein
VDVFDDRARVAAERVRRGGHADGGVVALVRADLDAVDAENARQVGRAIGLGGTIAVIREDGELQAGAARGGRNRCLVQRAVGSRGVDVESAADRARRLGDAVRTGRRGRARCGEDQAGGGREGRRQQEEQQARPDRRSPFRGRRRRGARRPCRCAPT